MYISNVYMLRIYVCIFSSYQFHASIYLLCALMLLGLSVCKHTDLLRGRCNRILSNHIEAGRKHKIISIERAYIQ